MKAGKLTIVEDCQRLIARCLASNPAGRGLLLIGGFRYRLLDHSPRRSLDIDYHWGGLLAEKQGEIVSLFRRKLAPELKRRFGLEVEVFPGRAIDKQFDRVKVVEVVLFRIRPRPLRIEIDLDITAVDLDDPPEVRTAGGVIYPTISDRDMVENKLAALFDRVFLQARDFLDVYLFRDSLTPDSLQRIRRKLNRRGISPERLRDRFEKIEDNRDVHLKSLDKIIEEQVDYPAAENLRAAGGAPIIFDNVIAILGELAR